MYLGDIENTLLKQHNGQNKCTGCLQLVTYFACSFISKDFFYTLGTPIFRATSEHVLFIFFPLTAICQARIYLFVSSKNQTSCTSFLQTGTWNLSHYSGCFLKFSPTFQNTEAAIQRCFTKVVVQQHDVMNYSSFAPVVKSRKAFHPNLLKITLHHRNFSKNLTQFQNSDIEKYISMTTSEDNYFLRTFLNSSFLKVAAKIYLS